MSLRTTYVDGEWGDPAGRLDVSNPADGTTVGSVGYGGKAEAAAAAEAAATAFPGWAAKPARARADLMLRVADLLAERADSMGRLLSAETGKRLPEGVAEVRFAAEYFRWFAEEARRPRGQVPTPEVPDRAHRTVARPAGVAVCLTPWNFPVSIQARKLAPALAAGCTTVSRASEKAPLAVVELFRCLADAGVPAGVVNLVNGPAAEVTEELLAHPQVRVVSFTGSTEVGRRVMALASERLVRPALELGGDAPFVVFDDADLDAALEGALIGKFRNNGQSCIAANRFLVHDRVYDDFVERLVAAVDDMSIGDPVADPVPDLGPLIDDERVRSVRAVVDEAASSGARRLTREQSLPGAGSFMGPVLLDEVPDGCELARSEVFGPVAGIFRFGCEEEALSRCNDTEMGLAAYCYTRDVGRIERFTEGLEAGIIGVNTALSSAVFAPMGGVKQSGLGREGGHVGLEEFQETHYVTVAY